VQPTQAHRHDLSETYNNAISSHRIALILGVSQAATRPAVRCASSSLGFELTRRAGWRGGSRGFLNGQGTVGTSPPQVKHKSLPLCLR
jgi:hypothetical protein